MPRDARHLLRIYGIEGAGAEPVLALARESRQRGWWQTYAEAIPDWFATYVGLEAEAASISVYQAEYVPGLLQTREYAEAANRAALMTASDDEIEKVVAVRMTRQKRLEADDAPQLWAVLNEAVIRRMVGGRAIMRDQILRLIEVSRSPGTLIQVLPFSAGAHPAMDSAFCILGFREATDGDVVYFEHPTCSLYLEKPAEVARYRLSFDHLRAASHSADESRRLLTRAAEELA